MLATDSIDRSGSSHRIRHYLLIITCLICYVSTAMSNKNSFSNYQSILVFMFQNVWLISRFHAKNKSTWSAKHHRYSIQASIPIEWNMSFLLAWWTIWKHFYDSKHLYIFFFSAQYFISQLKTMHMQFKRLGCSFGLLTCLVVLEYLCRVFVVVVVCTRMWWWIAVFGKRYCIN